MHGSGVVVIRTSLFDLSKQFNKARTVINQYADNQEPERISF